MMSTVHYLLEGIHQTSDKTISLIDALFVLLLFSYMVSFLSLCVLCFNNTSFVLPARYQYWNDAADTY